MIRHCVFLRLKPDTDPAALDGVMAGLAALVDDLPGCRGFVAGPNRDFEGKSPDHGVGFTLDAEDAGALAAYAADARHRALGARLIEMCAGGAGGIVVYDIEGALPDGT